MKKIAVGGAAVVGASAVISSPAFADSAPTVTGRPTLTPVTTNPFTSRVRLQAAAGTATCPGSALPDPPTGPTQTATLVSLVGTWSNIVVEAGHVLTVSYSGANVFQGIKRSIADNTEVTISASEGFDATVTATWSCTYTTGTSTAEGTRSFQVRGTSGTISTATPID